MLRERLIKGHKVIYDENAREGLDHIVYDLSYDETYSLFSKAKVKKELLLKTRLVEILISFQNQTVVL